MSLNLDRLGAHHLAPGGGSVTFEPQRAFNWVLVLTGIGAFSGQDDVDLVRLSVESVSFPEFSTAKIPLRYLNEDVKVSGGASVADNNITVRDFVDKNLFRVLNKWMEEVHDPVSGKIGYAANYKKTGSLYLVGPDGEREREVRMKGVWPTSLTASPLSYESVDQVVKIAMTLSVDKYDLSPLMSIISQ